MPPAQTKKGLVTLRQIQQAFVERGERDLALHHLVWIARTRPHLKPADRVGVRRLWRSRDIDRFHRALQEIAENRLGARRRTKYGSISTPPPAKRPKRRRTRTPK